jgi:hypothetical protein
MTLAALGGLLLSACYADSGRAPKPTLTTPGAFVAAHAFAGGDAGMAGQAGMTGDAAELGSAGETGADAPGRYQLLQILIALEPDRDDQLVFYFPYGWFDTLEAARDATRFRPPTPLNFYIASVSLLESADAVVVGYRSLTEEEQDVIR